MGSVTAVTADLKWEIPEDNGGSPVTHYIVERKNLQRNTWQEAGKPQDLAVTVTDLHDQNQYLFRVSAVNAYGVSEPVETTEPITAKNPFSESEIQLSCGLPQNIFVNVILFLRSPAIPRRLISWEVSKQVNCLTKSISKRDALYMVGLMYIDNVINQ